MEREFSDLFKIGLMTLILLFVASCIPPPGDVLDPTSEPPTPNPVAPNVTLTSPNNGLVLQQGQSVQLSAQATDSDGSISRVEFYRDNALVATVTTGNNNVYSHSLTGLNTGTHSFKAVAFDNQGLSSESTVSTVRINSMPQVSITSPTNNQQYNEGTTVSIQATATDSDGSIARVEFYINGTLRNTDNTAPYTVNLTNLQVEGYNLTARAYDNDGASSQSSILFRVNYVAPPLNPPPSSGVTKADIVWFANHVNGNLNQWSQGGCGGEFNNGGATSSASNTVSLSRGWSAQLRISNVNGDQGTRLFRWCESHNNPELYYSAWFNFPQNYNPTGGWWNIFQFKSKVSNSQNDPFFILNVGRNSAGQMNLYLYDWQRKRSYTQSLKTIPVGQWTHIEARYRESISSTGLITVWQDGVEIFNVQGLSTRYNNGDVQWSINNYASGISPDPATIYIDDAVISRVKVGTGTNITALMS